MSKSLETLTAEDCALSSFNSAILTSIFDEAVESCQLYAGTFRIPERTRKEDDDDEMLDFENFLEPDLSKEASRGMDAYTLRKLRDDILFLHDILTKGAISLSNTTSYYDWYRYMIDINLKLEEDERVLRSSTESTTILDKLTRILWSDKTKFRKELDGLSDAIGHARDSYEMLIKECGIKQKYYESWERARKFQNTLQNNLKEGEVRNRITTNEDNLVKEHNVQVSLQLYNETYKQDREDDIENWMASYDNDMESKEEEIIKSQIETQKCLKDHEDLKNKYETRVKEMEDWLARKAEMQRIAAELKHLNDTATKIQAWWRGTMVRNKLGPYRPKRKGKKKKKGKKAGK